MGRIKDRLLDQETAIEIFGDFRRKFIIASDEPTLHKGDLVTLVNKNCEFEFDNIMGCFQSNLLYYHIVDLELVELDLSQYNVDKSNNGGAYGFGTFKVLKHHQVTY